MLGQPPDVRGHHNRKRERHQVGPRRAPGPSRVGIEQEDEPERRGEREGRIFRPEGSRHKDAGQDPVEVAAVHDGAPEQKPRKRPERQLHLVVRKFHDRKIVEVDALQCEDCDQSLEFAKHVAHQEPHAVEADRGRQRAEHIDRVNVPDHAIGEVGEPPRQWRMLPVAELPFAAEREVFEQVELKIGRGQDRHDRPDHDMQTDHPGQHGPRPAAGEFHRPVEERAQLGDDSHSRPSLPASLPASLSWYRSRLDR